MFIVIGVQQNKIAVKDSSNGDIDFVTKSNILEAISLGLDIKGVKTLDSKWVTSISYKKNLRVIHSKLY